MEQNALIYMLVAFPSICHCVYLIILSYIAQKILDTDTAT